MSTDEQKLFDEMKASGTKMHAVCDALIKEFHRHPMQPNLGQIVLDADSGWVSWENVKKRLESPPPE